MTTVAPTSSQTPIGAAPVGTSSSVQIELNGTSLSPAVGTIISGVVLGRDQRGAVQLRTQNGIILLQTATRLPPGAMVTLQVQAVGAQIQAVLLQVTPLSAQALLPLIETAGNGQLNAPGVPPASGTGHASAPTPPASQVAIGNGPTVTATVIGPPRRSGTPAPGPAADPTAPPAGEAPQVAASGGGARDTVVAAGQRTQAAASPTTDAAGDDMAPTVALARTAALRTDAAAPGARTGTAATPAAGRLAAAPAAPAAVQLNASPAITSVLAANITAAAPPADLAIAAQTGQPASRATTPAAGRGGAAAPPAATSVLLSEAPSDPSVPGAAPQASVHAYEVMQSAATARPAAATPHATNAGGAAATQLEAAAQEAAGSAPAGSPAPGSLPARLNAGSELDVRVTRLGDAAIQDAIAGHPQLVGTVAGRTPTGQAIIDTSAGRLALALPAAMGETRVGMRVMLDVVAARVAAPLAHEAPARTALEGAALRPMLDALADVARASRGHVDLHDLLPRPGPQLAQQLADVAAAISTGKVSEWIGERSAQAIEQRGQGETLRRLEGELYEAAKTGPQSPEWHGNVLPFYVGGQLQPLRLYIKRRNGRGRERANGTRFVLECAHDEFGDLQIDGLVHERKIDIVLRSHHELPEDMRGDIMALFGDACGVMGYAGTLEFHAGPPFIAMPQIERAARAVGVVA